MQSSEPKPIEWDFLIDHIFDEQSILILGPEAFVDENGLSGHTRLLQSLNLANNPLVHRYYEGDDFVLFENLAKRTMLCHKVKKFYQSEKVDDTLKLLAEIPFHVFLTVTPDTLMCQAFKECGFDFQHGYYKKNADPKMLKDPSKEEPLIYNLFGCIKDEESLVLSHNDLYDYFKSIFTRQSMSKLLKDELSKTHNLIFLGVPFDKWYFQLLLRELDIHNETYKFTAFAANQSLNPDICTFCHDHFKINFVDKNIPDFVIELHKRCAEENILRQKTENIDFLEQVKSHLADSDYDNALNLLYDKLARRSNKYTGDLEIKQQLDLLWVRYGRLKKRINNGVSTQEQLNIDEAQIAEAILGLINEANRLS